MMALVRSSDVFATFSGSCFQYAGLKSSIERAPLDQFFKDLWSTGYRGALSIELFNPEYWKQDPLKVAKTSLDRTKAIMKKALG